MTPPGPDQSESLPSTAGEASGWRATVAVQAVAWLLVCMLGGGPAWLAASHPPPGRWFSGSFLFQDDYYQYLSFAEQASRGHVLFYNKFDIRPHDPFLVNLTWWAGGAVGGLFGGDVRLGFRLLQIGATAGLVMASSHLLVLGGLSGRWLGWALLLFFTGGGLGWSAVLGLGPPWPLLDLETSLYPSMQVALGAHALAGTALFLGALGLLVRWREGQGARWPWVVAATLLGLTRPFELIVLLLVVLVMAARDLSTGRRRPALAMVLECAWLAPVLTYAVLAFRVHPAFQDWSGEQNRLPNPPLAALCWALAPAVLALTAAVRARARRTRSEVTRALTIVAVVALGMVAVPWLPYGLQFLSTLGPTLLLLVALAVPRAWLAPVTLALSPASLVILWRLFHPPAAWFPPVHYLEATQALRASCQEREVAVAPEVASLFIAGLTPCSVVAGHRVLTPDLSRRRAEMDAFYDPAAAPGWRSRYLREVGARYVVLPAGRRGWIAGETTLAPRYLGRKLEAWEVIPTDELGARPPRP